MSQTYLLTPGPTPIPERVLQKMAEPIIHHRTAEFEEVMAEVREGLKWLFQTKEDVLILASSGTGGMEAVVTNLLSPGDKALAHVHLGGLRCGEEWDALGLTPHLSRPSRLEDVSRPPQGRAPLRTFRRGQDATFLDVVRR